MSRHHAGAAWPRLRVESPYGVATRVLHWTSAALVTGLFSAAWMFATLGPGVLAAQLVETHRSLGLLVLLLTIARLAWRVAHPLLPVTQALWERWLAGSVQTLLYMALLGMPVLGWVGSNANGDAVTFLGFVPLPSLVDADQNLGDRLFTLHAWLGYTFLALLTLHVAGALRHHFIKRDGVLQRMVKGRRQAGAMTGKAAVSTEVP